ncbi:MAG: cob(I)yrinic acid a,c-diamide adenosyltransferase [Paludibacteraceae bacterium]|nr:cob(I)yrinic acid a,c-diamide adenosyltransferase [Paludibacteraceae bacterium]
MRVYTKTGDGGKTSLADGSRVEKTSLQLEAYGTVDELNSFVGLLRAEESVVASVWDEQLRFVQNKLFNLGAALAGAPGDWICTDDVQTLEHWIDAMQATLPVSHDFLLPSGSRAVALAHVCRTITRRSERNVLRWIENSEKANEQNVAILPFLNRLSDYFFVLSRTLCQQEGKKSEIWSK